MRRFGRRRPSARGAVESTGELPVLAIDVDGVVLLHGFAGEPPSRAEYRLIAGAAQCVSIGAAPRLRRLAGDFDCVWASGWEAAARQLGEALDLPPWPYLEFGGTSRFGSADWKLEPLGRFAAGRGLAWIDDSFDRRCYDWAREREQPTLLIPTEPELGIEDVHVDALLAWARSLRALPARAGWAATRRRR